MAVRKMNNCDIADWGLRHDIKGTLMDLRCAFEDAQSFEPGSNDEMDRLRKKLELTEIRLAARDVAIRDLRKIIGDNP